MLSAERLACRLVPPRLLGTLRPTLSGLHRLMSDRSAQSASARMALFAFAVRILSAGLAFLSQLLLARWMGGAEYGVFVASVILGGLSCLAFQTVVIRFAPEYRVTGEAGLPRGVLFASRIFAFASASVLAVVAALLVFRASVPDYYLLPLVIGAACLPMMALGEALDGTARAHAFARLALLPTFIVRPIPILCAMALATGPLGRPSDAETAVLCLLIATYATTLGQFPFVRRGTMLQAGPAPREMRFRAWMAVALPIFLVDGFFNLPPISTS